METALFIYKNIFVVSLKVVILFYFLGVSLALEFNRNYTGVTFLPFVLSRNAEGNFYHPRDKKMYDYKNNSTRVMLRVVAKKFSRLLTYGMGGGPTYIYNSSYYNDLTLEGHAAEAAARVNKELGHKALSLLQGVWWNHNTNTNELKHAFEATEKANHIYPGTVEGIVFANFNKGCTTEDAERTTHFMRIVRSSSFPNLMTGAVWNCDKLKDDLNTNQKRKETNEFETFLNESNFIICNKNGEESNNYEALTQTLLTIRDRLLKVNPRLLVMARIKWRGDGSHSMEDLNRFRFYWESINGWAGKNTFLIYLDAAIEVPHSHAEQGYGWWNLSDNGKIDQIEGYVELLPEPIPGTPFKIICKICGIILAVMLSTFGLHAVFKLIQKQCRSCHIYKLSKLIHEFQVGLPDEKPSEENNKLPCHEALRVPYHKPLDTVKDQFIFGNETGCQVSKIAIPYEGQVKLRSLGQPVWLRISKENIRIEDLKEMMDEIKILTCLREHPNIVTLQGVCTEELHYGRLWTALEFCSLGSLDKYIRENMTSSKLFNVPNGDTKNPSPVRNEEREEETPRHISTRQMIQWSYEIAEGMEYLGTKLIIHGSLAACNVHLTSNKTAKIWGFKLNRQISDCVNYMKTGVRPTMWRWLSVESMKEGKFSAESDAWSYGVTLWEIFSMGCIPYGEIEWTERFVVDLEKGLRLRTPSRGTLDINEVLYHCWMLEPTQRLNFVLLKQLLKSMLEKQADISITSVEIS